MLPIDTCRIAKPEGNAPWQALIKLQVKLVIHYSTDSSHVSPGKTLTLSAVHTQVPEEV
jgi:hypothetical protein